MTAKNSPKKTPGVLLPGERPLRSREVVEGLYVVEDNPYTDRFDFFESSHLYEPSAEEALDLSLLKKHPDQEP